MPRPHPIQPSLFYEEVFTPEEMGWVRLGPGYWEKPDGTTYIFPWDSPELIYKLMDV